jgi:hypothetical protein
MGIKECSYRKERGKEKRAASTQKKVAESAANAKSNTCSCTSIDT